MCGIVEIEGKVLLVRHTYGSAEGRILLPGGYVTEGELATLAAEREILEETGVRCKVRSLISMQFKPEQWCAVFVMDHLGGEPRSDGHENSEVLLLSVKEAIKRDDITNMSREILTEYLNADHSELKKSAYLPKNSTAEDYVIFGV